ncbi:SHOCT domain-containing protein [Companilactobacillus sp. FL22-1]|uniref:SHOCT domain-containing protein n=1 Tax=Companilactobacillus sp. FL22-1 TaxID=3373892 RepID=UPI0037549627
MMGFASCGGPMGLGFMGGGFWYVIGIIAFLVLIVVSLTKNNHRQKVTTNSALDILDQEYAKGNVSDDDYLKRKENLKK